MNNQNQPLKDQEPENLSTEIQESDTFEEEQQPQEPVVTPIILDPDNLISFVENLNLEDLTFYNNYLISTRISTKVMQIIFFAFALYLTIDSFIGKEYLYGAIGILFVIYAALLGHLQKFIAKKGITRKVPAQGLDIQIQIAKNGFSYNLTTEKVFPLEWKYVKKVISFNNYYYFCLVNNSIIIFKKSACNQLDEVDQLLKTLFVVDINYITKNR